jgi:TonB-linked SusC/RagA family outer membrane protein
MRKSLLLSLAFLISAVMALAQDRTISGKVTSVEDGSAIPGVNIVVKGTTTGAVTDVDGNYKLTISGDGNTLVFTFIGMVSQEVIIGSRSVINLTMALDSEQLSEIIVTGYGSQTKEAIIGAVSVIDTEKLQMMPKASFQDALQGASPGLQVVTMDGAPGAGIAVRVRGIGSINASNEPLYVLDGQPITSGAISETDFSNGGRSSNVLSSINPNDIESLVVLKDAASTAIYGSRGANGVVLITTKSGKRNQKARIDVNTRWGTSDFAFNNILQPINGDQYYDLYVRRYVNQGNLTEQEAIDKFWTQFPVNPETGTYYSTNWLDEITQKGFTQEYDVSINGGSDKFNYFISTNYYDQNGTIKENKFERMSVRANISGKLTDKLSFTNNMNISNFNQRGITDGTRWAAPMYLAYLMAPAVPVYDQEGQFYADHKSFFMGGNNPVGQLFDDKRELRQTRITDNLSASYEIMEGLTFKSAWSFDMLRVDEYLYGNPRYGDARNRGGTAQEARTTQTNWIGTQTLNYGKTFNNAHNIDILLGYEAQMVKTDAVEMFGEGFAHPSLKTLASAANPIFVSSSRTDYAFNSYFARANYDYQNKYFGSASIRRDGSSKFGPDKRWGTFYSIGAGYAISEERFMDGVGFIDFLKLRVSYGVVGNAGIGNYEWAGLWGFNRDYDGKPGAAPSQVANPLLTWETQENFNIGLDYEMLGNRLRGTFEYFTRNSSDLLLDRPISNTTGFTAVTQNFGDMTNSGIEIAISGDVLATEDWLVSLGANITLLTNEITFLPESFVTGTKRREQGRDYQEFYLYGWAGVDPANGDPLWYTDSTKSETTNNISAATRFYDGKSATPDSYGGANIDITYKGFTLGLIFNYQTGNYVYDNPGWVIHGDGRFTPRSTSLDSYENEWRTPGQEATFPKSQWGGNQSSNTRNSDRYLYNGDFVRLKKVNFQYSFPTDLASRIKMRSLQVYVSLDNFLTWVKDDTLRFDPEQTISGVYNTITPISKTVSFGINMGF